MVETTRYDQTELIQMERAIHNVLDDIMLHSQLLVAEAIREFGDLGPGAWLCPFKNKAHLMTAINYPCVYVSMEMVRSMEYAPALRMCSEYDPSSWCVLICMVNQGNGVGQFVSRYIHRDGYTAVAVKFDTHGSELTSKLTFLENPTKRNVHPTLACVACHIPAKFRKQLKTCNGCKAVKYCGKTCQKRDWPSHKLVCMHMATI